MAPSGADEKSKMRACARGIPTGMPTQVSTQSRLGPPFARNAEIGASRTATFKLHLSHAMIAWAQFKTRGSKSYYLRFVIAGQQLVFPTYPFALAHRCAELDSSTFVRASRARHSLYICTCHARVACGRAGRLAVLPPLLLRAARARMRLGGVWVRAWLRLTYE